MTWKEQLQHLCKESSIISNRQIYSILPGGGSFLKFEELMRGKTCPIADNGDKCVYSWDLERILNRL